LNTIQSNPSVLFISILLAYDLLSDKKELLVRKLKNYKGTK